MIRGSILSGKIVAAPLVASLALVAGLGILVFGCVALPIYGSYRLAKHVKNVKIKKTISKNLKTALSSESIEVQAKNIDLHYSIESNTNLSHISVPNNNNESSGSMLDNHSSFNQAAVASASSQSAHNLTGSSSNKTATSSLNLVANATRSSPQQLGKLSKSQYFESSSMSDSGRGSSRTRSKSSDALTDQMAPSLSGTVKSDDQKVPQVATGPSVKV